jgi:hypothetical protein
LDRWLVIWSADYKRWVGKTYKHKELFSITILKVYEKGANMNTFYQDYLERLTSLHQEILNAIEGLFTEALDWTPLKVTSGDMNPINVLVIHLCGAERYWIGDVACGDLSGRVRAEEFQVHGMDADFLAEKINTATTYAQSALKTLKIEDLGQDGTSPRDGRKFTVGWALLHALEHTAIHLGHIQITRQLWDDSYK